MIIKVKSVTPQEDGSNDYLINLAGVGAEVQKLPIDIQQALSDGKVSPEEAATLIGDLVNPVLGQKLLMAVMIARAFGIIRG